MPFAYSTYRYQGIFMLHGANVDTMVEGTLFCFLPVSEKTLAQMSEKCTNAVCITLP